MNIHAESNTHRSAVRTLGVATLVAVTALATGCESSRIVTHADVVSDYESGQYQQAYDDALTLAARTKGQDQARAHYLAGLSAYQLRRDWTAIGALNKVKSNHEHAIAGPANATIGLSYARLGRHDRAIAAYQSAVGRLHGNEQAQAYYHMAVSEQKLGRWSPARSHLAIAAGKATDPGLRDAARAALETVGYTLQFGAYGKRANADERAKSVYQQASKAGVGPPRIVTSTAPNGSTLYLVQAGRFGTFDTALAARRRLGRTDVLITSLEK